MQKASHNAHLLLDQLSTTVVYVAVSCWSIAMAVFPE